MCVCVCAHAHVFLINVNGFWVAHNEGMLLYVVDTIINTILFLVWPNSHILDIQPYYLLIDIEKYKQKKGDICGKVINKHFKTYGNNTLSWH
jgi:hypothetical protein